MWYVINFGKILCHEILFIISPIILGGAYFFEVYKSVAIMTFKGHKVKRLKKSYFDIGDVIYIPEPNRNLRFENQVLGAIVSIPTTIIGLVTILIIIFELIPMLLRR